MSERRGGHTLEPCKCTVDRHNNITRGDERPCYVHLAAPDMLEALRGLMFFCENMNPKEGWLEPWDKARAAIAKAEGR